MRNRREAALDLTVTVLVVTATAMASTAVIVAAFQALSLRTHRDDIVAAVAVALATSVITIGLSRLPHLGRVSTPIAFALGAGFVAASASLAAANAEEGAVWVGTAAGALGVLAILSRADRHWVELGLAGLSGFVLYVIVILIWLTYFYQWP